MLKLLIKQANWGVLGSLFGFTVGFFIKIYLIDIVGISEWGKYVSAHAFATAFDTILAIGIPFILLKFLPDYFSSNKEKANRLIQRSINYAFKISFLFLILMYFLTPYFDHYIYKEIEGFYFILFLVSIHAPISILLGIMTSLYRSIFKIKELVLYSTFVTVTLRAVLTFFAFQFTDNIVFFITIELFTGFLAVILLFYFFNRDQFRLFNIESEENKFDAELVFYGKKIYANSLASFFGNQSLALVLSIMLPPMEIGVFSILLTITGVSLFLIQNLNKIFAPVISKLYAQGNISELNQMFKKTTFIINLITLPLTILIIYFSKEILVLYDSTHAILDYLPYLYVLMGARIIALLSGSSGMFMIMAGIEDKELMIQIAKAIIITFLAILFVKSYGLLAIVGLFIIFTLLVNGFQLFFINQKINIHPFSRKLFLLLLFSTPLFYYAISNSNEFSIYQLFWVPCLVYAIYFLVFYKSIRIFYSEIFSND